MLIDDLQHLAELLLRIAQALGSELSAVPSWEYLETIAFDTSTYEIEQALTLDIPALHALLHELNIEVTCYFALHEQCLADDEDEIVLNIFRDGHKPDEVNRFRERILPCDELIFVFTLEKSELVRLYNLEASHTHVFLFLFKEAILDYFGRPQEWSSARSTQDCLRDLERGLWPGDRTEKIIILTQALPLFLDGPYLAFAGGELLHRWRELSPTTAPDMERLNKLYNNGRELVKWDRQWVQRLTPYHLDLHAGQEFAVAANPTARTLHALLQQHLLNLCVLFTANHTIQKKREWVAGYWDAENRVEMPSAPTADASIPVKSLDKAPGLLQAVRWVYTSQWPRDRIYFLQSAVTQEVRLRPTIDSNQVLLDEIETIHTGMERRLAQFVRDKEHAFSAAERALQTFSIETAESFSRQTSEIIKAVSETMLAAIAALLGSFIAAGFDNNSFDARIFTVGMVVYALYVLFFPLLYNMSNQWSRFHALAENVDAGYGRFSDKLGSDRAQELAGERITGSKRRFQVWFYLTVVVYILAIIGGLVAAFLVPQLLV